MRPDHCNRCIRPFDIYGEYYGETYGECYGESLVELGN